MPVTSTGAPDAVSRKMAATVSPTTSGTVRAPRAATTRNSPQRISHHVQVMNQHFGNHQPLHVLRIGLALDAAVGGRSTSGNSPEVIVAIRASTKLAQLAGRDPSLQLAVPGPEPPVLVRHEPRLALHATDERLRLGERRRERLLAQDVDAALGRGIDPGSVGFARRDHVEGVDGFGSEHRIGIAIDVRDRKFSRALLRPRAIRIADRDEMHALAQVPPADKVIPADHSAPATATRSGSISWAVVP